MNIPLLPVPSNRGFTPEEQVIHNLEGEVEEWEAVCRDKATYGCDITHYKKVVDTFKRGIIILRAAFNIKEKTE